MRFVYCWKKVSATRDKEIDFQCLLAKADTAPWRSSASMKYTACCGYVRVACARLGPREVLQAGCYITSSDQSGRQLQIHERATDVSQQRRRLSCTFEYTFSEHGRTIEHSEDLRTNLFPCGIMRVSRSTHKLANTAVSSRTARQNLTS